MRIDFGMVLGIALGYIFFIYYADTLFYRKINKAACYSIIGGLYLVHLLLCVFGNLPVNVIVLFSITFLSLILCYHVKITTALFQSFIITLMADLCELSVLFIPYLGITFDNPSAMNPIQSLILTLTSKTLYLICIIAASKLFASNKLYAKDKQLGGIPPIIMIIVPILTICALLLMLKSDAASKVLSGVCLLLILINIALLIINKSIVNKDLEISELKAETMKENFRLEEYLLLKEKHESMNIIHHDFKEHMSTVSTLMDQDVDKAKEYIKSFCKEEAAAQYVKYTNNDMLNILLSKKKEECLNSEIEFIIDPILADMSFISDIDTVALFSNLINNAIEGCNTSDEKKIFLNITTTNENFITIKMENTAAKKPLVIDGKLRTYKKNKDLHGIGMNSIRRTLKRYDASLNWSYDADSKLFSVLIVIQKNKILNTAYAK